MLILVLAGINHSLKTMKYFLFLLTFILVACTNEESDPVMSGMIATEEPLLYEFGDINIEGGVVSYTFTFENVGEDKLYLYGAQTSCMCTEAQILLPDGSSSPVFGMHSDPWIYDGFIAPEESFQVQVSYDPMAHGPEATGEVNRSILLFTSSEENARLAVWDEEKGMSFTQMNIHGMVLSAEEYSTQHSDPEVLEKKALIEAAYPEFLDFENQESFAGQSVESLKENGDYFFAYIVHGSGVYAIQATCFKVDTTNQVTLMGTYPEAGGPSTTETTALNPKTCTGIVEMQGP